MKTKTNINQISQDFLNGWINTPTQPTYASANTMNVPNGVSYTQSAVNNIIKAVKYDLSTAIVSNNTYFYLSVNYSVA